MPFSLQRKPNARLQYILFKFERFLNDIVFSKKDTVRQGRQSRAKTSNSDNSRAVLARRYFLCPFRSKVSPIHAFNTFFSSSRGFSMTSFSGRRIRFDKAANPEQQPQTLTTANPYCQGDTFCALFAPTEAQCTPSIHSFQVREVSQ